MPIYGSGIGSRTNLSTLVALNSQQPFVSAPTPTCSRLVIPPTVDPAGANTLAIVNNSGTTVAHLGGGIYRIVKTGGTTGNWDADAVSSVSLAGDFVLRLSVTGVGALGGVNADPLTDSFDTSIDFAWEVLPGSGFCGPAQNGSLLAGTFALSASYYWMWRIGTTLSWGRGATLAAAQAAVDYSTTYGTTCYFDSTMHDTNDTMDVLFYSPQDLVGSSSLTFSASATATGKGALSGTSALTFTPTGTATGTGALSGTSTLTFSPSSTLTGKGALTGASSVTFAPAGTITGKGALTGTAPLTFAASATLTGAGALAGSSAATFSPSGTITGSGALSGSASLTFSPSAILTGMGELTGTASVVFAAAGSFGGVAVIGPLTGSANLAFSVAGTLTGIPAWLTSTVPDAVTLTPSALPASAALTITPSPSATPLAVSPSPSAGTFLQDNEPAQLEWSA